MKTQIRRTLILLWVGSLVTAIMYPDFFVFGSREADRQFFEVAIRACGLVSSLLSLAFLILSSDRGVGAVLCAIFLVAAVVIGFVMIPVISLIAALPFWIISLTLFLTSKHLMHYHLQTT